jgi:CrcB protein
MDTGKIMKTVLAIALGGAFGAVARYFIARWSGMMLGEGFPWGTLTVNVVGCFAMGMLVELMSLAWSPSTEMRAFLTVGILGALTTFSTFSLDIAVLHGRGETLLAACYLLISVVASIVAIFAGLTAMRMILQ